ncbi:MAG: hypothetical protein K5694_06335 [Bacilli bacterium]|nr:hypothetical protein [Bacilli bacterium]
MTKDLLKIIKSKYKENELFSLGEIASKYQSYELLKVDISRLVKEGKIAKASHGVYYLVSRKKGIAPSIYDLVELKYLKNGNHTIGFYSGESYIQSISKAGLEGHKIEIYSNKCTSGKREMNLMGHRIILRRPYIKISDDNCRINAFLTYISTAAASDIETFYPILANHIRTQHFSADDVISLSTNYPDKMTAKLLSSDLYRSLWKH